MTGSNEFKLNQTPDDGISSVKFSPNTSQFLLVSSWDTTVRLYDVPANTMRLKYQHSGAVLDCAFYVSVWSLFFFFFKLLFYRHTVPKVNEKLSVPEIKGIVKSYLKSRFKKNSLLLPIILLLMNVVLVLNIGISCEGCRHTSNLFLVEVIGKSNLSWFVLFLLRHGKLCACFLQRVILVVYSQKSLFTVNAHSQLFFSF